MKLIFADEASGRPPLLAEDQDRRMVQRINKLIRETQREPISPEWEKPGSAETCAVRLLVTADNR